MTRRCFAGALVAGAAWPQSAAPRISNLTAAGAVNNPYGLRIGLGGELYVCEIGNHRVSKIRLQTGALASVVAGQKEPYDLRFDGKGILYFVDMPAHQVRSVNLSSGKLTVVAGTGDPGFSGDGGPAARAQFKQPHSIAFTPAGRLLVCDIGNHRIRSVDLETGLISTFAGTGEAAATPEGAPRAGTPLHGPRAIDFDAAGNLYLALREGNCILKLDPKTDRFARIAGTGEKGYTDGNGDARRAKLSGPKALCCAPDGSVYIADTESHAIRRISRDGAISTVAGTGEKGDGPLGDPLRCGLNRPHGVFVDGAGTVFIGDSENHCVRKIS